MNFMIRILPLAPLALVLGALSLSGCSGKKVDDNDPSALFQAAEDDIKNDQYLTAIEKLKLVRNKFPYSHFHAEAQLRLADVYFLQESYGEAAAAYESFKDLHPKHTKVPYAMFRIGESYQNDAPSNIARDQSSSKKAEDAFNEFIKRFGSDPKAEEAKKSLSKVRTSLAQKEYYIANFYKRVDQLDSARRRYQKLIQNYPETDEAKEARVKLSEVEAQLEKKK